MMAMEVKRLGKLRVKRNPALEVGRGVSSTTGRLMMVRWQRASVAARASSSEVRIKRNSVRPFLRGDSAIAEACGTHPKGAPSDPGSIRHTNRL
jgi:hypothetical protein